LDKLQIGEGGYGKVFIAKDKQMEERRVAVKKVTKTGCSKVTEGFYREIAIMKELDHPNICKLLGTFEQNRDMYFIMELCEGGELFDRIIESGKIDQPFSATIIKQVASALAYAHSRSIAHRDIKPENVVFCTKDSNQVKLIDWGLAMSFMGTSMTSAVGSFTYAAPEVITSNNISAYTSKCDLWSLGVLTYVMLSGKPPFWGNHQQFVSKQKKEQYPMKGEPWDKMDPKAKDFVKKLLKANPDERLPIDKAAMHEWLTQSSATSPADALQAKDVLTNLKHYSGASTFERLCITAVARQLDHKNLSGIHSVFRDMDTNGDGVLSLKEVQDGFRNNVTIVMCFWLFLFGVCIT
jgi:calcium-dependent protein kinase